jgi:mRNA interferase RelE/StbE
MPRYTVEFLPSAAKEFKKLPLDLKQRIGVQIEALSLDPRPPGAKTLQGGNGQLCIRVGDYRVIYRVQDDKLLVLVLNVGHRSNIYRNI